MKAFKVFHRNHNGNLESSGQMPAIMVKTYKVGEVNTPDIKGSKLFVFLDLLTARACQRNVEGVTEIWEVEAEDVVPIQTVLRVWYDDYHRPTVPDGVYKFWNERDFSDCACAIRGAHGASSVKLLRKVEPHEEA